jgi:GNAT superfamily N-acetyltransferase
MTEITIEKRHGPPRRIIGKGLDAYNASKVGKIKRGDLTIALRDGETIIGGITGRIRGPTLVIEWLWIDEVYRGKNHGTALIDALEAEGRRLGAKQAVVDTFTFQARPFYEKCGYVIIGHLKNFLEGQDQYWLQKAL